MSSKLDFIRKFNIQTTRQTPSEWAEENRVMTSDVSRFTGKWSYNKTPYTREIVDTLSPDHPMRILSLMGGSQTGKSHGFIFNGIGYIIKNAPGNILLTCGDDDLTKGAMVKIDQMIENSGLRHLIRPNTIKRSNQKTGDTDKVKEFVGGSLIAQSIKAVDKIKQNSFQYGFLDDFESANRSNSANVGDIFDLVMMRFNSFRDTMKVCMIGVPEIKQTSLIEPAFMSGDQRYYMMPCPCCGKQIRFIWNQKLEGKQEDAGIVFETDSNHALIENSVGYICQECGNFFKENKKTGMLHDGIWMPSAKPSRPDWYSYHLSGLYAPTGFFNWTHYAYQYLKIFPGDGVILERKLQSFQNHVLAQTYEEKITEIDSNLISRNIRNYEIGTIPNDLSISDGNGSIILLTMACDLNGFEDDARLDYEILAHSETGSTYSIDHGSIGSFQRGLNKENREIMSYHRNCENSVWDFLDLILQKEYSLSDGQKMKIAVAGIDTGFFTQLAYNFIDKHNATTIVVGMRGDPDEKLRNTYLDTPYFKESKERLDLYLVQTNQIKDALNQLMKLKYNPDKSQEAGFMNYPSPSNRKYDYLYFEQYEGEIRKPVISANGTEMSYLWQKKTQQSKNHFWDCRVYNLALREIFIKIISKELGKKITWIELCNFLKT